MMFFKESLMNVLASLSKLLSSQMTPWLLGTSPDHSDHDQAFTSLLQTAQKCNVKLNFDKLQYKQNEVNFLGETYTTSGHKQARSKVTAITAMPSSTKKKQVQSFIDMIICPTFCQDCQSLQN